MADHPNNMDSGLRAQESLFSQRLRQLRSTGQIEAQRKPSAQTNQPHTQYGMSATETRVKDRSDDQDLSEMERIAFIDPLTEQLNSRAIISKLKKDLNRARRYRQPLALIVLEIDGLSNIVGRIPTLTFETMLKGIAKIITKNVREVDRCGFYDNNKFMLVCPETNQSQASVLADRLRHCFSLNKVGNFAGAFAITVSGGISSFPENGSSDEDILNSAFKALNEALNKGGNSIVGTSQPVTSGSFSQYLDKEMPGSFAAKAPAVTPAQQNQPVRSAPPAPPPAPPTQVT